MSDHEELFVRLATNNDFEDVLEMSKGIYDGRDCLPKQFHNWLQEHNKFLFVGELEGKIIGLQMIQIIDGGNTAILQAFRIHPMYRGRGYSYLLTSATLKQVQRKHLHLSKVRFTTEHSNKRMQAFATRLGYDKIMEMNFVMIKIKQSSFKIFTEKNSQLKELQELNKDVVVVLMLSGRNLGTVISNKMIIVDWIPYQVIQSNMDLIFKEGDIILSDASEEEIKRGQMPNSFSHGRIIHAADMQVWHCTIYAEEYSSFKAHFMQQMILSARKLLFPIHFEVFFHQTQSIDKMKIIQEEFGNNIVAIDDLFLFESSLESIVNETMTKNKGYQEARA